MILLPCGDRPFSALLRRLRRSPAASPSSSGPRRRSFPPAGRPRPTGRSIAATRKATSIAPLAQIHAANVHRLEPAWEYHTGDATERSTMHVNPIVVNGVMYITTPSLKAVALDAATGREIWSFDPAKHNNGTVVRLRNRGRDVLEGRRRRADLPLRQRPRLRGRRQDRRADHVVRQQRLHRPPAEPRRRSGHGGDRDDLARAPSTRTS